MDINSVGPMALVALMVIGGGAGWRLSRSRPGDVEKGTAFRTLLRRRASRVYLAAFVATLGVFLFDLLAWRIHWMGLVDLSTFSAAFLMGVGGGSWLRGFTSMLRDFASMVRPR
jgi:hypothetical protein